MNVLISYSAGDKDFGNKLEFDIRKYDIEIQSLDSKILPGEVISDRIVEEITHADCYIVILSRKSANSPWLMNELSLAMAAHLKGEMKIIIPVIVDKDVKTPVLLEYVKYADFTDPTKYTEALQSVVSSIKQSSSMSPNQIQEGQKRQWEYVLAAKMGLSAEVEKYKVQQSQRNFRIFFIASIALSLLGLLVVGLIAVMIGNDSSRQWLIAVLLLYVASLIILIIVTAKLVRRKQQNRNTENCGK